MGKADAPAVPDYKGQAIATANLGKYSENSPFGTVQWSTRPGADMNNPLPGDYIRTTELSPEQRQLYDQQVGNQLQAGQLAKTEMARLGTGTEALQDALYRRATRYYDQNFGDQGEALRTRLLNQGLTEGTAAYQREMRNFGQNRDTAYADAADRALIGSDQAANSAVARLNSILNMSRGTSPTSGNTGAGPDLLTAANQQYNAMLGNANAENAASMQTQQAAAGLASMLAMIFL